MSVKAKADESEGEKAAMQDHIQTLKVTVRQPAQFFFLSTFLPSCIVSCVWDGSFLLPYSVQLQQSEDSDTFSACWVVLVFP